MNANRAVRKRIELRFMIGELLEKRDAQAQEKPGDMLDQQQERDRNEPEGCLQRAMRIIRK